MAVSPEQREIERKAREIKLQEDRLERKVEQQKRQENKLAQKHESVSQREATVSGKEQDIKTREDALARQLQQLQEAQTQHSGEQQGFQQARKRRLSFMLPVLLLAGVGAGYLTYDYYAKNDVFAQRLSQANSNVNRLSDVLTQAEDLKIATLQTLALKEDELTKIQGELKALKNAYAGLESEKSKREQTFTQLEDNKKILEASLATLTAEKETALQTLTELNITLEETTRQLNESTSMMAGMTKNNEQLNASLDSKTAALNVSKTREEELTVKLEENAGVLIAAKQAIDERDKIIDAKVKRQSALELELATLQEQHEMLMVNRDKLAENLGTLNQTTEAARSELVTAQRMAVEKSEALDAKLKEMAMLETQLKDEKSRRAVLDAKLTAVQNDAQKNATAAVP